MISLQGSIRDCKIDTGWAERLRSDRFENPNKMVCPMWSGRDLVGRPASIDSFYTKLEGCNTPLDRVSVENALRPMYMEQTTEDAYGFRADLYTRPSAPRITIHKDRDAQRDGTQCLTLTDNTNLADDGEIMCSESDTIYGHCPFYPYDWNQRQDSIVSTYSRKAQSLQHKAKALNMQRLAGF